MVRSSALWPYPHRLPAKFKQIREALNLSQEQMAESLTLPNYTVRQDNVSKYESGKQHPPLTVLLQYSRLVNVCVDSLIDDETELPKKLPARTKHQ